MVVERRGTWTPQPKVTRSDYNALVNTAQASALNESVTPSRSVVSRTIITSAAVTSTHWPPLDPE
jgi:hypothetical protein